jgi:hypothetical protein
MWHRPEHVESNFARSPVGGHRPDFRTAAASINDDAGAETPADEAMAQRPSGGRSIASDSIREGTGCNRSASPNQQVLSSNA